MNFDSLSTKVTISDRNISNFEKIEQLALQCIFEYAKKCVATMLNQDRKIFEQNVHIFVIRMEKEMECGNFWFTQPNPIIVSHCNLNLKEIDFNVRKHE